MDLLAPLKGLLNLVWPNVCEVCGRTLVRGEEVMCLGCWLGLPRTHIHTQSFGAIHHRLAGHTPIDRAGSYFYYYRGSPYTRLIHGAKYFGRPRLASFMAARYATEILADGFFAGIDLIVPVPLHRMKMWTRGYNQSMHIAKGISSVTGIPIAEHLIATHGHSTQTRKHAYERWINAQGIYKAVNAQALKNKHILIVDDVLTTGSTLVACCDAIHSAEPSVLVSVLTLSMAHLQ